MLKITYDYGDGEVYTSNYNAAGEFIDLFRDSGELTFEEIQELTDLCVQLYLDFDNVYMEGMIYAVHYYIDELVELAQIGGPIDNELYDLLYEKAIYHTF